MDKSEEGVRKNIYQSGQYMTCDNSVTERILAEIRRIAVHLGKNNITGQEFQSHCSPTFSLYKIKNSTGLSFTNLRLMAGLQPRKSRPATKRKEGGTQKQANIFCKATQTFITAGDCVPYYRDVCISCESMQKQNSKSVGGVEDGPGFY